MKKLGILILSIFSLTILTACNTKITNPIDQNNKQITTNSNTCKQAIQNYLSGTNKIGTQTGPKANSGDLVTVMYIGRFNDDTVFDTNIKSVAEACGLPYNPKLAEGLSFTINKPGIIQGFSKGTIGLHVGETQTVTITPEEGYGPSDPNKIFKRPLSEIDNPERFKVGMKIQLGNTTAIITEKNNKEIVIDANHPMAGKNLIFDITLKDLVPAK